MKTLADGYLLSNGVKIPCVGYGTWQTPAGDVARDSVVAALQCGYRHIDTATAYGNEASVGEGLRLSGVKREEIFLTTKQWTDVRGYEKTVEAGEKALKALGTDYIDLYLVHWPAVQKYSAQWQELNAATWKGFEKLYKDGKVRAIGVSNFLPEHLAALKQQCEIPPMVDQVEFHPGYIQKDVLDYCNQNNIRMEAWSPLGSGRMLANPLLNEIGAAHGKSAAQVCVRYAIELGVVPLPKSVHAERLAANADVFDFSLTAEELAALNAMPETGYSGYNPNDAPAEQ
ncbi:MAG: aldo/keto reductase [Kiritimatiellae bacterium]|nr:aldo/keto reductase [Kiritimatiellia bacterium]